jgi:hypothetical protein
MLMDNIYQIDANDFNDVRLICDLPTPYLCLYDTFKNMECEYESELQDLLILSKSRSLKLFFRSVNERLKFLIKEFESMPNSQIKTMIMDDLICFIKRNLSVARQNMTKEKAYTFKSEGCLDHRDPEFSGRFK